MSINRLQRPRLAVVGNGLAGMRTVEELVARAPDHFAITAIGASMRGTNSLPRSTGGFT